MTQESHVASHFGYLDITNAVVTLMMLSALHAIDTSANGFTRPKSNVLSCLNHLYLMNAVVSLMMLLAFVGVMLIPVVSHD